MIIFTSAYQSAVAETDEDLKYPRICYENLCFGLTPTAVSVSSEAAGYPGDAPMRPDTAEWWEPTALPATWDIDLGQNQFVDFVGIAGHNLCEHDCVVYVEMNTDLSFTADGFATLAVPTTNSPLLFLDSLRTARYVRITVEGGSSVPHIGSIYIGQSLIVPRLMAGSFSPPSLSRKAVLTQSLSRGGHFLAQTIRRNGYGGSVNLTLLEPDWYRASFDPFVQHAQRYPYFFAWNPEENEDVVYAWTPNNIAPAYMGFGDFMQVSFELQGQG